MAAYLFAEITVTDPTAYEEYRKLVGATVEKYGGKFLVRGGTAELVEGEGAPGRPVIVEFESMDKLKAWYDSEEYREPKAMRQAASTGRLLFLPGA
jgi:uncharacterized protein (DUF1330 family)